MSDTKSELIEYALGVLDAKAQLRIDQALAVQPALRAELEEIQQTLNSVSPHNNQAVLRPNVREQLFQSINAETPFAGFVTRLCDLFDLDKQQVQSILQLTQSVEERPWVQPGIKNVRLLHFSGGPRVSAADCGLVYMKPGAVFPSHQHGGDEWSLILQGQVCDNGEKNYFPGDFIHYGADSQHNFQSLGEQPLILAVVMFSGFEIIEPQQ